MVDEKWAIIYKTPVIVGRTQFGHSDPGYGHEIRICTSCATKSMQYAIF